KGICHMNHIISIVFFQNLSKVISHAYDGSRSVSRNRINKFLLGMGMIDQDLRLVVSCFHPQIHLYQRRSIQLFTGNAGGAVHRIKIPKHKIKVLKLFQGNIGYRNTLLGCRSALCLFLTVFFILRSPVISSPEESGPASWFSSTSFASKNSWFSSTIFWLVSLSSCVSSLLLFIFSPGICCFVFSKSHDDGEISSPSDRVSPGR